LGLVHRRLVHDASRLHTRGLARPAATPGEHARRARRLPRTSLDSAHGPPGWTGTGEALGTQRSPAALLTGCVA
jgi:hypothetical protein